MTPAGKLAITTLSYYNMYYEAKYDNCQVK